MTLTMILCLRDMRATNVEIAELPIRLLQRGPSVNVGGKSVNAVVLIDPTPIDSLSIITTPTPAPANGFYSPVSYRGGFAPNENWLAGWSAADEFGFLFEQAAAIVDLVKVMLMETVKLSFGI